MVSDFQMIGFHLGGSPALTLALEAFIPRIPSFHDYLTNLPSASDFSGPKLLEIMATFQDPFEAHMRSEISTIASLALHPKTPKEGSHEEKSVRDTFDSHEGKRLMGSGMTDVLPFFLFNFDCEYEDGIWRDWPPIPGPVRWAIMSTAKVLHPGWWRFASCDSARRRRELYASPTGL
jgi:hypothetical protein